MNVVRSVNIGAAGTLKIGSRTARSGIDKRPADGPVQVGPLGLQGDHVLNTRYHGGPDQAVYLYSAEDYAWWQTQGLTVSDGLFGENLTVTGLPSAGLRVGDRLFIGGPGGVTLEVTAPRVPCSTLAAHLGDPGFVKRFAQARRPGAYTRVLQAGVVQAGDPVTLERAPDDAPTLAQLFDVDLGQPTTPEELRRLLTFPLAQRSRADLEQRLAKAEK